MRKDDHLIYEAFESKFTSQTNAEISVANNLMKMNNALEDMSTVIHMSKSSHIDQLLSRIRDTVEMLMSERGSGSENSEEDIEDTEEAYNKGEEEHYRNKEENAESPSQKSLNSWEAEMKKQGFEITKDNKTGTYHAWQGKDHKSSYRTQK